MFFKVPGIDIRIAVKFSPSLKPFTIFTSVIFVFYSHAVFVCHTQLVWDRYLTVYVLMILRPLVYQDSALVWRWWPGLTRSTLWRVLTDICTSNRSCGASCCTRWCAGRCGTTRRTRWGNRWWWRCVCPNWSKRWSFRSGNAFCLQKKISLVTNTQTDKITSSLLELLVAAKNKGSI